MPQHPQNIDSRSCLDFLECGGLTPLWMPSLEVCFVPSEGNPEKGSKAVSSHRTPKKNPKKIQMTTLRCRALGRTAVRTITGPAGAGRPRDCDCPTNRRSRCDAVSSPDASAPPDAMHHGCGHSGRGGMVRHHTRHP